jgi:arylformamidase
MNTGHELPRVIDLTHPLTTDMPCYPGTEPPTITEAFTVADHGYAELRLTMLTHTGTHIDAPAHMLPAGRTLDDYPAGWFVGRATVIDVARFAGGVIERADLEPHRDAIAGLDYVLLYTGWAARWGEASYYDGYPVLGEAAARWLAGRGLRGVGVDAVSVDAAGSTSFAVHRVLLASDLVIVENLTGLAALRGRSFLFSCLPLKITGADGAPVRAVAMLS